MLRVGFVGIPGSGKTTTARVFSSFAAKELELSRTELVSEYARRYIAKYGLIDDVKEQYRILQKQLEWEDSIPNDTDLLVTDSPVFMGFMYAIDLNNGSQKDGIHLSDIFKRMTRVNSPRRYDYIFYLPPFIKPVVDGVRAEAHFTDEWRAKADRMVRVIFDMFPPKKFIEVESTDIMDRVNECIKHMKG